MAVMSLADHHQTPPHSTQNDDGRDGRTELEQTARILLEADTSIANIDVYGQSVPMNIIQRYYELSNKQQLTPRLRDALLNIFRSMVAMGHHVNYMNYLAMRHKDGGEMLLHLAARLGVDRCVFDMIIGFGGYVHGVSK